MSTRSRLFASAAFPLLSISLVLPNHAFAVQFEQKTTSPDASVVVSGSFEVAQNAAPDDEELKKRKPGAAEGEMRAPEPGREQAPGERKRPPAEGEAPAGKPRGAEPGMEPAPKPQRQNPEAAQPEEGQPRPGKGGARAPSAQEAPQAEQPKPEQNRKQQAQQPEPEQPRPPAGEPAPGKAPKHQNPATEEVKPAAPAPRAEPSAEPKAPPAPANQEPAQPKAETEAPKQGKPVPPAGERNRQAQPQQGNEPAPAPTTKPATPAPAGQNQAEPQNLRQQAAPQGQAAQPNAAEPQRVVPKPPKPGQPEEPGNVAQPAQPQPGAPQPPKPGQPAQPGVNQAQPIAPAPNGAAPQQAAQPATPGQAPAEVLPPPEKVTKQELEQRQKLAEDPAKAKNQTIVLPVENGAPVLDSDKRAYRLRAAGEQVPPPPAPQTNVQINNYVMPKSDADAQRMPRDRNFPPPLDYQALSRERGERLDGRPRFDQYDGVRVDEGPSRDDGNRVVIQFGDNVYVRHDDDVRFIDDGYRPTYDRLPDDRYREVIERPDGWRIVTIRNRYGDIIQRSRVDRSGREYVLFYSPDLAENPDQNYFRDPGDDLPPMHLRVPLNDYIIDTSSDPDRDYYQFLSEPPVEPVERVYSLNEVRYSARLRDKVRRIDLDTLTFATGSWEIPMNEASTLRRVADAMNELLKKNPSESFLIEGHTDAVGSAQSNLVLSDRRAESVARVLTDAYSIPAENMVTQGYGEQYLKVNTSGPNQENRRVTIRRITPLVRPMASNQ
ncbi:OmpA family protein [Oryzifoliimicrobium ureilyticus]|uniref:OmpA family protein n=1 Tax=Oryzifoliimicrobium ureilyticus TaxID=3113724 RepID=UPI0030766E8A